MMLTRSWLHETLFLPDWWCQWCQFILFSHNTHTGFSQRYALKGHYLDQNEFVLQYRMCTSAQQTVRPVLCVTPSWWFGMVAPSSLCSWLYCCRRKANCSSLHNHMYIFAQRESECVCVCVCVGGWGWNFTESERLRIQKDSWGQKWRQRLIS